MKLPLFILSTLFLSSCGLFQFWGPQTENTDRKVASEGAKFLLQPDLESFNVRLDQKLHSLHSYYLIGQRSLRDFDREMEDSDLEKLYASEAYLSLVAVRTQVEEIEEDIKEAYQETQGSLQMKIARNGMKVKILKYAQKSPYAALAMENLMQQLELELPRETSVKPKLEFEKQGLEAELRELKSSAEFAVYEKNIEHLSHMLDTKIETNAPKFYPDAGGAGNIAGTEFPAKVWSLTFDDGPRPSTSSVILKALKERNMKATFFQLTQNVKAFPEVARTVREAGMEIASHSYTHADLTKVGKATLEKEVTKAVKELGELHDTQIKFFRLPYGAGVHSTHIREKIAENNLIHVYWNIDTLDWMPQEPSKIASRAIALMKKSSKDSGVILFHDIHVRTTKAAPQIMDYLKKDGRRVCTLDEIVTQMNQGAETVCPLK